MARLFVIVATVGRAALTACTIDLLADQTRPADGILVVSVSPSDVTGVASARSNPEILFSQRGLCRQRNLALRQIEGRADYIVFFDDDFIPRTDYLENLERLFQSDPTICGITGELIADGIKQGGFSVEEAQAMIRDGGGSRPYRITERAELYGCNMAYRVSAIAGLRFDEVLPQYGWMEDIDFSAQVRQRGRVISCSEVTGVHMGITGGRSSGRKLGYSQVANVTYLKRKGTMRRDMGNALMIKNIFANILRSFAPEPHIDRRGRLAGNALAIIDLVLGRVDPRRIDKM